MAQCKCDKKLKKPIIEYDNTVSNEASEIVVGSKKEEVKILKVADLASLIQSVTDELPMKTTKKKPKKTELLKKIECQDSEIQILGSKIKELSDVIENHSIQNEFTSKARFAIKKGEKLNKLSLRLKSEIDQLQANELEHLKRIELLEQQLEEAKTPSIEPIESAAPADNTSSVTEDHLLRSKFTKTKSKLFDALNQNAKLKNELKLAQKCIQQEIGDNINLSTLLGSNSSGWRGREQKIMSLQTKIADLKLKLEIATNPKQIKETPKFNEIRQIHSFHRSEYENLQSELYKLREVVDHQKSKINALKAHKSVLSEDTTKSRLKLLQLLGKSENDDKYIKKLNEQLDMQAQQYELNIKDLHSKISEVDKLKYNLNLETSKLLVKLENFETETNEKTKTIQELNEHVTSLETDLRSVCGGFLFSCRQFTKDQFLEIINGLEREKEDLLEFINTLNNRCDESRLKLNGLQEENSKLKASIAKAETKLKKYENKESSQRNKEQYRTLPANSPAAYSNSTIPLPASTCNFIDLEELRFNCESLRERITFLEENLQEVKYEKEMDWKLYTDTITKSKKIMVESFDKENKKK